MAQMVDRTGTGRAVYQLEGTLLGLSLVAELTGRGATLHHDQLIEGDLSPWLALGLFLAAWQVMIAAMMLPSSLPMLDLFDRVSAAQPGHRRARWAFLAGYAVVWTGFGALAFQLDGLVHRTVDATPGSRSGPGSSPAPPCCSPAASSSPTAAAARSDRSAWPSSPSASSPWPILPCPQRS
jgi:Predicted metal-binding integral membrane protein (DUF2182)